MKKWIISFLVIISTTISSIIYAEQWSPLAPAKAVINFRSAQRDGVLNLGDIAIVSSVPPTTNCEHNRYTMTAGVLGVDDRDLSLAIAMVMNSITTGTPIRFYYDKTNPKCPIRSIQYGAL